MSASGWTWSEAHQDQYYASWDKDGNPVYIWAKQLNPTADSPSGLAPAAPDPFTAVYGQPRTGYSQTTATYSQPGQTLGTHGQQAQIHGQPGIPYNHLQTTYNQPEATYGQPERTYTHPETLYTQPGQPYALPAPVPSRFDSVLQKTYKSEEHIRGTDGNRERLDPSYYVREKTECYDFFKQGRVLAMLWTEPAGATSNNNGYSDKFTVVTYGEKVYTNIRRFVVVQVPKKKGFVYACGITTYSHKGVLKNGCTPKDHAAVYFSNTPLRVGQEEYDAGLRKEAIEIQPSPSIRPFETLHEASRINLGKTVTIEKNVKVKDIGRVAPSHMSMLLALWKAAKGEEEDDE